jgi:predicted esterase
MLLIVWIGTRDCPLQANETDTIVKQTFIYAIKDADTLRLDKYDHPAVSGNKPCLIFVFGGGFAAGARDDFAYIPFYKQFANNGYSVVAIDYRLGMKNLRKKLKGLNQSQQFEQVITIFNQSITMAVEDLFDATKYVIEQAPEWHINTDYIISCGSSAGAITVLQGEYEISNAGKSAIASLKGFNYAGVISFAGAIFSTTGKLEWAAKPAPILLFHGDADKGVPYDKTTYGKLGFYGSGYISKQLKNIQTPYYFYSVENTGHEVSNSPMQYNWEEIVTFLTKLVFHKENLMIDVTETSIDKPILKEKLTIEDLIGSYK